MKKRHEQANREQANRLTMRRIKAAYTNASLPVPLRGRRLLLARVAWIVVAALALGLFIIGIPAEFTLLHFPCATVTCPTGQLSPSGLHALEGLGLSLDSFAAYTVAMDALFAAVCTVVALLIFWRRSDDPMGLLVSLALLTFARLRGVVVASTVLVIFLALFLLRRRSRLSRR
jgi:hypothetical protein